MSIPPEVYEAINRIIDHYDSKELIEKFEDYQGEADSMYKCVGHMGGYWKILKDFVNSCEIEYDS